MIPELCIDRSPPTQSKLGTVTSFRAKRVICVYQTHYLDVKYLLGQTHQTQTHRTHFTDTTPVCLVVSRPRESAKFVIVPDFGAIKQASSLQFMQIDNHFFNALLNKLRHCCKKTFVFAYNNPKYFCLPPQQRILNRYLLVRSSHHHHHHHHQ